MLALYFIVPAGWKNTVLLVFSLIFYAWGEPTYILLMLLSIVANYGFGIWIGDEARAAWQRRLALTLAVIFNIGLLSYFKYAGFLAEALHAALHIDIPLRTLPLPIGISFYTFHALSYLIDIYRYKEKAQRNLPDMALYITFFPQLVAGPIVRYHAIAGQLRRRTVDAVGFAEGVKRFIQGLAKKVLLANPLGAAADTVFAAPPGELSTGSAWIGILAYTLQIYFDFSGYSDMAIGLAKMFGFQFAENFNYPYIAKSVSEFWRRWHISLGSWFRDYVYIPLGGSRTAPWKIYRNLLIVWTLTGLWHGASWTFVAWGAYYGLWIALEKAGLERLLARIYPFNHVVVLLIVMIGWVFFRADDFGYAAGFIAVLFDPRGQPFFDSLALSLLSLNGVYIAIAILLCAPIRQRFGQVRAAAWMKPVWREALAVPLHFFLLVEVILYLVNSTYNPFLYFRF